eukprot:TRINITY_DN6742_c0_g1_i1.p1 TRINITY_DN6742_c0_g1~~TRINITY_DN6742_c0_g1_i1.p1  ORF type:complete len:679 (-),score=151.94 TRINITY_DN6742_c0_g1_i1:3-1997(-)
MEVELKNLNSDEDEEVWDELPVSSVEEEFEKSRRERIEAERQLRREEERLRKEKLQKETEEKKEQQKIIDAQKKEQQRLEEIQRAKEEAERKALQKEKRAERRLLLEEKRRQEQQLEEVKRLQLAFDIATQRALEADRRRAVREKADLSSSDYAEQEKLRAEGYALQQDADALLRKIQSLDSSIITIERGVGFVASPERVRRAGGEDYDKSESERSDERNEREDKELGTSPSVSHGELAEDEEQAKLIRKKQVLSVLPVNNAMSMAQASFSYVLSEGGHLYSWGYNANFHLGHQHNRPVYAPTKMEGVSGVVAAAATADHIGFITADGSFSIVGKTIAGPQKRFVAVDASDYFLLLAEDGELYTFDDQFYYDIQKSKYTLPPCTPELRPVYFTHGKVSAANNTGTEKIVSIAMGMESLVVFESGRVWNLTDSKYITGLSNIVSVAAGKSHYLALDNAGQIYSWGSNIDGECGLGWSPPKIEEPMPVTLGLNDVIIVAVAAGSSFSVALSSKGELYSWGWGEFGKLGQGRGGSLTAPEKIAGISNIISVACFQNHVMAIQDTGAIYTWGCGEHGRLGGETDRHVFKPQVLPSYRFQNTAGHCDPPKNLHWTSHASLNSAKANFLYFSEKFLLVCAAHSQEGGLFYEFPREILYRIFSFMESSCYH